MIRYYTPCLVTWWKVKRRGLNNNKIQKKINKEFRILKIVN
jgi:hypothetical protein